MEFNSVCNHGSDNKIERVRECHLFITRMITNQIGLHDHKNYDFREKKNNQVKKQRGNLHKNCHLFNIALVVSG